ncbi:Taste receptor type 1 member 1 G-protein coupled receptor 70 Precursor [Larimichthys crocea]|uniref:Taste receptor type 1 member 1 G-protein coupled receptor 70 n=1 Tax=Larimichthys crocea TaxID=215358 RepID=A0A6G0IP31_LARCR|nr:Taste receptor type 1 member 1 G-protein coupled receptor 70 Precursor [Larimichthys crocea]
MLQAMRFTVEQINNGTRQQRLLPGVKLGYQLYDSCSISATMLATLDLLEYNSLTKREGDKDPNYNTSQGVLAVIGPDSSSKTFMPAFLLGSYLIPQISYQSSNEMLSNKLLYPSFYRTIPNDKNQVAAMIQILVRFNWTWIALLASDNAYGRDGIQSLYKQASDYGICVAYQGVIPNLGPDTVQTMRNIVQNILKTKVNTIVVFSSKTELSKLMPYVLEQNVTDKVWIGSDDWATSSLISGIPGIQAIGTVIGVSNKFAIIPGFVEFERKILFWLKQVNFTLDNTSVYFDMNGDPPTGYDLTCWAWRGKSWSLRDIGTFNPDPITLTIDADKIEWHNADYSKQIPLSICSPPCPRGHKKLLTGQHTCCFHCQACPADTFLNISDPTVCQVCLPEEWSPEESEQCLSRTILLLDWDNPLSIALLFFLASCVLMTSSSAIILLLNLSTPVAKSAGGRTCLLMLAALTAAAMSSLCHFGRPSPLACILKQPLFIFSFTVCLACITVRSLQVVCIFKFASKLPPAYDKWTKNHGPELTIFIVSVTVLLMSVIRVAINPPKPSQDLDFYFDSIVLECSNTLSPGAGLELAYVALLSVLCFSFSYMGKDLPANYNEAKCITFSPHGVHDLLDDLLHYLLHQQRPLHHGCICVCNTL